MAKLFFTIGLPRASKSTLAKEWLNYENCIQGGKFIEYSNEFQAAGYDYFTKAENVEILIRSERRVLVSGDSIRQSLYGSLWNSNSEDFVDAIKWTMVKTLLSSGHTVLLDETNTSERSIRKILEIDIEAEFAFVDTHPDECKNRALKIVGYPYQTHSDLIKPIDRMTDNIRSFVNDYADDKYERLIDRVSLESLKNAIESYKVCLIYYRKHFTNEPIRTNPKLSEVPAPSKNTSTSKSNSWTTYMPEQPTYQVW